MLAGLAACAGSTGPVGDPAPTPAPLVAIASPPAGVASPAQASPVADAAPGPDAGKKGAVSPDEVARLKALGYVDVADEEAGSASGVVKRDAARSQPGYSLFTNAFTCSTQIIDATGRVVHEWSRKPCFRWDNTTLLPDGDLLVVGRDRPDETRRGGRAPRWEQGQHLARLAWDGTLRWEKRLHAHHDAEPLPDGRLSVLTNEDRLLPEIDPTDEVVVDELVILSPAGEILEKAPLYDMLRDAPGFVVQQRPHKGEANSDLIHANAIDWMRWPDLAARDPLYAIGNVLVCMRHQDAVAMIDWRTKTVVWHWGQGELSGPHDAQMLPNGHVLLFDNGVARRWSRVLEVDPLARKIVWQWQAPDPKSLFSLARGSTQRLDDGNTLVTDSDSGRSIEVTPEGEVVWEFLNPSLHEGRRVAIVRMRRLPAEAVDRLLAGGAAPGGNAPEKAAPRPVPARSEPGPGGARGARSPR